MLPLVLMGSYQMPSSAYNHAENCMEHLFNCIETPTHLLVHAESCSAASGVPYDDFVGQGINSLSQAASIATSGSAAFQSASYALTMASSGASAALNDASININSCGSFSC